MAEKKSGLFREKSLERLSSPERLDQLLRMVDRKTWLPLGTLAALVLALLIWSVFGKIPVTVSGQGILVRPRKVVDVQAPIAGYVTQLEVEVGSTVKVGDLLARIERPDLKTQLELQTEKLIELTEATRKAQELRSERSTLEASSTREQTGQLETHIRESRELADSLLHKGREAVDEERELVREQLEFARIHVRSLGQRLEGQREMESQGLLSEADLSRIEDDHLEGLERLSELEVQLRALNTRELEVEEGHLDRLQRIADRSFELNGLVIKQKELAQEHLDSERNYEQQVADVEREIVRLQHEGQVLSEHAGTVVELTAGQGQFLTPGERVASVAAHDVTSPLQGLVYFTVRDGKRVEVEDRIQITPDTVERERYGGIRGRVTSVSSFSVTLAEASRMIGNREVAENLIRDGHVMQILAELEYRDDDPGRFRWSSSKGPEDVVISAGTTTTARITVEQRKPIAYVLPFLKSSMGVD